MNYLFVNYQTMTVREMFSDTAGSKSIFLMYDPAFLLESVYHLVGPSVRRAAGRSIRIVFSLRMLEIKVFESGRW